MPNAWLAGRLTACPGRGRRQVYLHAYANPTEARRGLDWYFRVHNQRPTHQGQSAIEACIAHRNTQPKPFIWTKSDREVFAEGHPCQRPLKFQTE